MGTAIIIFSLAMAKDEKKPAMARGALCPGSPWCVGMPLSAFRFRAVFTIVMHPSLWSNALCPSPASRVTLAGGCERVNSYPHEQVQIYWDHYPLLVRLRAPVRQ